MQEKKKINYLFIGISLLLLILLSYIESLSPSYLIKSIIKLSLLISPIIIYSFITKESFKDIIRFNKLHNAKLLIILMILAYVGIIILYLLLRSQIDLSNIKDKLLHKEHLTKDNFIYIFLYIIFINSLLEEVFFRGFLFHLIDNKKYAYIFSALCFAIYHIAIIAAWFNIYIFIFAIVGLFVVGLFLQFISNKYESIKASWLIHALANVAINTIGVFMLFDL